MARLPQPGGDSGNWGTLLNDYLSQIHAADGTLKSNTVGSTQLQQNSVTSTQIADNAITPTQLADNAVTATSIANDSITELQLEPTLRNRVNSGSVGNNTITQAMLQDNAVTTTKINDQAITGAKIANGVITDAQIDAITQAKITGLTTDLAGKASASHTHTASNITDFNSAADARITAASVNALSDVTISSPINGQVLKYNGSAWVNDTDNASGSGTPGNDSITNAMMADDAIGIAELSATGTADNTTFLRGDNTWQSLDKGLVGLGNVDNTSDLAKPVSTATQTYIDTKVYTSTAVFSQSGAADTGLSGKWRNPTAGNITRVTLTTGTAPLGSNLVVEFYKNATLIQTLTINDGSTTTSTAVASSGLVAGDILSVNATSVGSSAAATNVTAQFDYTHAV